MAKGKITLEIGAEPERHEIRTAEFFANLGIDIHFLKAIDRRGVKTPDILMSGLKWEIKAPKSNASRTIENAFRSAIKQSPNVIFDLRRSKLADSTNIPKIQRQLKLIHKANLKNLKIITKSKELLEFSK